MPDPTLTGTSGQAWHIPNDNVDPSQRAGLASWIVHIPGAHPFWSNWMVAVVHLRDVPGATPAKRNYPEAEYEFLILTINPEEHPTPTVEEALSKGLHFLHPVDVCEQFHGVTDQDAVRICESAVRASLNGRISPDQDFRPIWRAAIQETVKHFREGKHLTN